MCDECRGRITGFLAFAWMIGCGWICGAYFPDLNAHLLMAIAGGGLACQEKLPEDSTEWISSEYGFDLGPICRACFTEMFAND